MDYSIQSETAATQRFEARRKSTKVRKLFVFRHTDYVYDNVVVIEIDKKRPLYQKVKHAATFSQYLS